MKRVERMAAALEAYLFVQGNPVSMTDMTRALQESESDVREALDFLKHKYESPSSGIMLHVTGAGWALATKKEYDAWLTETTGEVTKLSSAAMETLAVIASREPVTRSEIDRIRGVSTGRTLSVLINRGLVEERGRLKIPGRPILYGTTKLFLKCTGLSDISELRKGFESAPKEGTLF
jgi:segregation and condensation protein B